MAGKLIRVLAEEIARDILERKGSEVSETTVAIEAAAAFRELDENGAALVMDLILGFTKVGDVHVSIASWKVKDNGEVMTNEEFEKSMEF